MPYVYLIKMDSCYKIGIAQDVESRLAQLQTGSPYDLEVVQCYEFQNAQTVEGALHQKFGSVRMRGEWFRLGDNHLAEFGQICAMLGGTAYAPNNISADEVEEADELSQPTDGAKFDFAAMFKDGWCMLAGNNKKGDWCWRKRNKNQNEFLYGGLIRNLPLNSLEEMRRVYGGTK
jgi:hypothetical protein